MSGQGRDTNTVLTNRSNYLTVVSDVPYCQRKQQRFGLPALRNNSKIIKPGLRGLRFLHKSTLDLYCQGYGGQYESTMKDSFGGKCDIRPVLQMKICPSLHNSNFLIGHDSKFRVSTTNCDHFKSYAKQDATVHVDRSRWLSEMSACDIINSTKYSQFNKVDFSTTYSSDHQLKPICHVPDKFNGRWRTSIYNVCNEVQVSERSYSTFADKMLCNYIKKLASQILSS